MLQKPIFLVMATTILTACAAPTPTATLIATLPATETTIPSLTNPSTPDSTETPSPTSTFSLEETAVRALQRLKFDLAEHPNAVVGPVDFGGQEYQAILSDGQIIALEIDGRMDRAATYIDESGRQFVLTVNTDYDTKIRIQPNEKATRLIIEHLFLNLAKGPLRSELPRSFDFNTDSGQLAAIKAIKELIFGPNYNGVIEFPVPVADPNVNESSELMRSRVEWEGIRVDFNKPFEFTPVFGGTAADKFESDVNFENKIPFRLGDLETIGYNVGVFLWSKSNGSFQIIHYDSDPGWRFVLSDPENLQQKNHSTIVLRERSGLMLLAGLATVGEYPSKDANYNIFWLKKAISWKAEAEGMFDIVVEMASE